MKTSIKLAIASLLLVGGVANAANINTLPSNLTTGSSLVLFVKDVSTTTYYYEVLNATVSSVNSFATLAANTSGKYSLDGDSVTGTLTVPNVLGTFTSTNLSSFINSGGNSAANTFVWSILGSKFGPNDTAANRISTFTSNTDWLNDKYVGGGDVNGMANGVNSFFVDEINTASFVNGKSSTVGYGSSDIRGSNAPKTFFDSDVTNGAALGVGQYLWQVASNNDATGANVYKSAALLTLNSDGSLSYTGADLGAGTSPVPVPAAVWLLGSGLAGLAGIGRRRKLVA
jgi:hypothetical protein